MRPYVHKQNDLLSDHLLEYFLIQVQGILIGVVAAFVIFITIIGPEYVPIPFFVLYTLSQNLTSTLCGRNHSSHFEKHKAAFEEGAARDDAVYDEDGNARDVDGSPRSASIEDEKKGSVEKRSVDHERV